MAGAGDYDDGHDGEYGQYLPSHDDYTKEPPLLPPQLKHIMLNSSQDPSQDDSSQQELPMPQHVTLKHLYCTAIKVRGECVGWVVLEVVRRGLDTILLPPGLSLPRLIPCIPSKLAKLAVVGGLV